MARMYTVDGVVRLLTSYLDFRLMQEGQGQRLNDLYAVRSQINAQSQPFAEPKHARPHRDGKRIARQMQEIHVSMLDIEEGLKRLHDDDLAIIYTYYIFQTKTLDELCKEFGTVSRGAMSMRCRRSVERLVRVLEGER